MSFFARLLPFLLLLVVEKGMWLSLNSFFLHGFLVFRGLKRGLEFKVAFLWFSVGCPRYGNLLTEPFSYYSSWLLLLLSLPFIERLEILYWFILFANIIQHCPINDNLCWQWLKERVFIVYSSIPVCLVDKTEQGLNGRPEGTRWRRSSTIIILFEQRCTQRTDEMQPPLFKKQKGSSRVSLWDRPCLSISYSGL